MTKKQEANKAEKPQGRSGETGELSAFDLPSGEAELLEIREIKTEEIAELPNIRQSYHGIDGLAETMHLEGQLQPCWVRPTVPSADHGKPFELIFGYRRKRAAELLQEKGIEGWETLRCEVRRINDGEELSKVIVENFQREDPSPVAEAKAMLALKQSTEPHMSNEEIARRLGVDASQVSKRLTMLGLGLDAVPQRRELSQGGGSVNADDADDVDPEIEKVMQEAPGSDSKEGEGTGDKQKDGSTVAPAVAEESDAEPEIVEAPQVDILEMVDKGEISASTAEVIASLDNRADQEKLAVLAKRHQWPVRKAQAWAKKVKEHQLDEGDDEMGPVEWVEIADIVELPRLHPRTDLSEPEIARVTVYALLRNGMDREVIEYIDEQLGYPFSMLWEYVSLLDDEQIFDLNRRLALRYIGAAHRYHDLEPSLKDALGAIEEDWEDEEDLALPAPAEDQVALPGTGLDDPFGLPAAGESSADFDFNEQD